ncbi:hypothetical protein CO614_03160, partial [Lysobacteraceae bacterium NML120232]
QAAGAKATVSEGKNITVKATTNADGSTDYEVATKSDVEFDSVKVGNVELADNAVKVGGNTYISAAGLNANDQKITNVASGGDVDSNAANIGDVNRIANAAASSAKTHYYSVNDGGTKNGNYDNEGATGVNALAAGVNTFATAAEATALGAGATASHEGSVALGSGSVTADVVATDKATVGGITYGGFAGDAPLATVSVGSDSIKRSLTHVAAGRITADSTDAINGSQLYATQVVVGNVARTAAAAISPTSTVDASGNITANLVVGGNTYTSVQAALNALPSGMGGGSAVKYYSVNSSATGAGSNEANDGATGVDAIAAGSNASATADRATAIGAGAAASHEGSVALGAGSVTQAVDNSGPFSLTGGAAAGTQAASVISVGSAGNERRIVNVAAGRLTADSTDAVNGSQLFLVSSALNNLGSATAMALGGGTSYTPGGGLNVALTVGGNTYNNVQDALNAVNAGSGGGNVAPIKVVAGANTVVTQEGNTYTVSVVQNPSFEQGATFNGGISVVEGQNVDMGGNVVRNVSAGVADTDAVNVGQLRGTLSQANAYADARFNQLSNDMWQIDRGYRGATASAMAMAGLPQAYLPGKSMLAAGIGGYRGEYGIAVGLSGITDNGKWVYKAQASGNTARDWGFSAGMGIQW